MKFIYSSLICFLITVSLCALSSVCVIRRVEETTKILQTAITAEQAEQKDDVVTIVRNAGNSWKQNQLFFGSVLRHDEIDGVSEEFARLESYAATEDRDDFLSNCLALIARLEHICEMERPTFENIM